MTLMEEAVRECDPENFNGEFEEVIDTLKAEHIIDDEEANDYRNCLYGYLREYIRFASSERPPDRLVDHLYQRTLEMIDGAISTRDTQKWSVEDQMNTAADYLAECGVEFDEEGNIVEVPEDLDHWCERWLEDYDTLVEIARSLEEDKEYLENIKKNCWMADDRLGKIMCIETFVQSAHTRGFYLSTGCGLPLSEYVIYEEPPLGLDTLGNVANDMTIDVLNCLREFKGQEPISFRRW